MYNAVPYEERMPEVFAAADLAVCRAGASSVAELAAVGLPSVLVPLPGAPGDHQTANATALARVGGAEIIADADLTGLAGNPDGQVNFTDLGRLKDFFFQPPGPGANGCTPGL